MSGALICLLFILLPATVFCQCHGKERWPVKTGTDPDVGKVNTTPVTVGIDTMNGWNGGGPYSWAYLKKASKKRIAPHEFQVYHVEGLLTWYKCDCGPTGDQDYLLVIQNDYGQSIIAKIPSPPCVEPQSPFLAQIKEARRRMRSMFAPTSQKKRAMVRVSVEGPAFFDKAHGQLGRAENSVEIHPVLNLEFLK